MLYGLGDVILQSQDAYVVQQSSGSLYMEDVVLLGGLSLEQYHSHFEQCFHHECNGFCTLCFTKHC